jgi:hypothetical protein
MILSEIKTTLNKSAVILWAPDLPGPACMPTHAFKGSLRYFLEAAP